MDPRQQVTTVLGRLLGLDPASLQLEQRLREDLGVDSVLAIELVYELEEVYDRTIPDDEIAALETVQDVVAYVGALA